MVIRSMINLMIVCVEISAAAPGGKTRRNWETGSRNRDFYFVLSEMFDSDGSSGKKYAMQACFENMFRKIEKGIDTQL